MDDRSKAMQRRWMIGNVWCQLIGEDVIYIRAD